MVIAKRICVIPSEREESALYKPEIQIPHYVWDDSLRITSLLETQYCNGLLRRVRDKARAKC